MVAHRAFGRQAENRPRFLFVHIGPPARYYMIMRPIPVAFQWSEDEEKHWVLVVV